TRTRHQARWLRRASSRGHRITIARLTYSGSASVWNVVRPAQRGRISPAWICRVSVVSRSRPSADLEVVGRFLAAIADDFVLDGLPLIEGAQAGPLDCGDVNKNVPAAALRLNKAISLGRVEPLHIARGHSSFSLRCVSVADRVATRYGRIRVLGDDLRAARLGEL